MKNWISVKDKLPKNEERVLVWVEKIQSVQVDKIRVCDSYGREINSFRYESITHWMPLPKKP